jgi:hypothetical protein
MGITMEWDSIIAAAFSKSPATRKLHCANGEALRCDAVDPRELRLDELMIKSYIVTGNGDRPLQ